MISADDSADKKFQSILHSGSSLQENGLLFVASVRLEGCISC